jgi:hypothetical protein
LRRLTLAVLAVLALAGCGTRTPSDQEQIRSLLSTFARATESRDYQTLCDRVLAPKLLTGLQSIGLPCAVALRQSLGEVRNPRLVVGEIAVHGDAATAQVRTSADNQAPSSDVMQLSRVKGAWRVSALSGGAQAAPSPAP